MNKCDNIYYDNNENDILFNDDKHENIFIQSNKNLDNLLKNFPLVRNRITPFIPISSEMAFIYNSFIQNENFVYDNIYLERIFSNIPNIHVLINNNHMGIYPDGVYISENNNHKKITDNELITLCKQYMTEINVQSKIKDINYDSVKSIIRQIVYYQN
jgi:hypothetical protein